MDTSIISNLCFLTYAINKASHSKVVLAIPSRKC